MVKTHKPLFSQTAADIMTQTILVLPLQMSVNGAAHLLGQNQVTGAPVVNSQGQCVGVVSATDFMHLADDVIARLKQGKTHKEEVCKPWQMVEGQEEKKPTVGDVMTPNPVMVLSSTSIGELARLMIDSHIHRVIVVNEDKEPCGIVSSTDIVAALAYSYQYQEVLQPAMGEKPHPEVEPASFFPGTPELE